MSTRHGVRVGACLCLAVLFVVAQNLPAFAQSVSSHYKMTESEIGAGGLQNSASSSYQGTTSIGDVGVGNSASSNFQVNGGSQTTPDPTLTVTVTSSGVSLADFSSSTPAMGTSAFSVTNYTSYGYIVLVSGAPPTNGSHQIAPMTTAGTSTPGFEQFGINLVANTAPQNIGANPVQVPSSQFSYGIAATGYDTPNNYRYNDGDTIASAPKSSGQTNYKISYLVNVGDLTPGGQYTTNQSIIVVGTY